jgi:hypothetical protein
VANALEHQGGPNIAQPTMRGLPDRLNTAFPGARELQMQEAHREGGRGDDKNQPKRVHRSSVLAAVEQGRLTALRCRRRCYR